MERKDYEILIVYPRRVLESKRSRVHPFFFPKRALLPSTQNGDHETTQRRSLTRSLRRFLRSAGAWQGEWSGWEKGVNAQPSARTAWWRCLAFPFRLAVSPCHIVLPPCMVHRCGTGLLVARLRRRAAPRCAASLPMLVAAKEYYFPAAAPCSASSCNATVCSPARLSPLLLFCAAGLLSKTWRSSRCRCSAGRRPRRRSHFARRAEGSSR